MLTYSVLSFFCGLKNLLIFKFQIHSENSRENFHDFQIVNVSRFVLLFHYDKLATDIFIYFPKPVESLVIKANNWNYFPPLNFYFRQFSFF